MDPDEWLTVDEIAERLQVVPQTVRNWMYEGKLPYYKIGRRVRVRSDDFERFSREPAGCSGPNPHTPTIWDGLLIEASLPNEQS